MKGRRSLDPYRSAVGTDILVRPRCDHPAIWTASRSQHHPQPHASLSTGCRRRAADRILDRAFLPSAASLDRCSRGRVQSPAAAGCAGSAAARCRGRFVGRENGWLAGCHFRKARQPGGLRRVHPRRHRACLCSRHAGPRQRGGPKSLSRPASPCRSTRRHKRQRVDAGGGRSTGKKVDVFLIPKRMDFHSAVGHRVFRQSERKGTVARRAGAAGAAGPTGRGSGGRGARAGQPAGAGGAGGAGGGGTRHVGTPGRARSPAPGWPGAGSPECSSPSTWPPRPAVALALCLAALVGAGLPALRPLRAPARPPPAPDEQPAPRRSCPRLDELRQREPGHHVVVAADELDKKRSKPAKHEVERRTARPGRSGRAAATDEREQPHGQRLVDGVGWTSSVVGTVPSG